MMDVKVDLSFLNKRGPFCGDPYDNDVFCRRMDGHDGPHSAFKFSIIEPIEWDDDEPR